MSYLVNGSLMTMLNCWKQYNRRSEIVYLNNAEGLGGHVLRFGRTGRQEGDESAVDLSLELGITFCQGAQQTTRRLLGFFWSRSRQTLGSRTNSCTMHRQARRKGSEGEKFSRTPRRFGAPPSLKNAKYTEIRHFEKKFKHFLPRRATRECPPRPRCDSRRPCAQNTRAVCLVS